MPALTPSPPATAPVAIAARAPAHLELRPLLAVAAWIALLGAYGEIAFLAFDHLVRGAHVRIGLQAIWMTPAADTLLFLGGALLIVRPLRRFGAETALRLAVTLFAFLAVVGVIAIEHWSYPAGAVLLAAGVGVEAGRRAAGAPARFLRLVKRTLPGLGLLTLVLGVGYNARSWVLEQRALASLPPADAGAPNVLLLIWDTVRARSLSLYGYPRSTSPELQRLAARGTTFDLAIVTAPWTLPSHASMFTGRLRHELRAAWRKPFGSRWPTLAEVLADHGYQSAGFASNVIFASYEFGLDRGFLHYEDYEVTPEQFILSSSLVRAVTDRPLLRHLVGNWQIIGRKTADDVNRELFAWLDGRRRADRPFFAFLNEFDAHELYLPPAPFDTRFGHLPRYRGWGYENSTNAADIAARFRLTPAQNQAERDAYDGGIAYMDSRLGLLVRGLRARGLLDHTILIVTADHGEEFGGHGVYVHAKSLYLSEVHVPLVVIWPGRVPAGMRVDSAVSLADLPATIARLVGIARAPFPGRSLGRFWDPAARVGAGEVRPAISELRGDSGSPPSYPAHAGDLASVVDNGFHLIRGPRRIELYALRDDPEEHHNLAGDPRYAPVLRRLSSRLVQQGARTGRP